MSEFGAAMSHLDSITYCSRSWTWKRHQIWTSELE